MLKRDSFWFNAVPIKMVLYMIEVYIYKNPVHKHETYLHMEVTERCG